MSSDFRKPQYLCYFFFMACIFSIFTFHTSIAQARTSVGGGYFQRSQNTDSTRWTLADWMTQKKSFAMMDQWLALHRAKDVFEVSLEGGQQNYDVTVGSSVTKKRITTLGASVYLSIFGLQYLREDSDEDYIRESAQFNLRLFGTNSQSTYLTAFYGFRDWKFSNPTNEVKNQYAGAKLNLYILSFFGIDGQYRKDFKAYDNNNIEYEGDRVEYGAFVDVYYIRLYGKGFKETTTKTPASGSVTKEVRDGIEAGVQFYF